MNLRSSSLMLAATTLLLSATALAAQTQGRPDLSGVWAREGRQAQVAFSDEAPPLRPAAKAIYEENRGGMAPGPEAGLDEMDPTTYCLPHGMTRVMAFNYPFEIVQTPEVVYMLFEAWAMQRRIFLDGRTQPEAAPPRYMGFSTGRYDGDTLVVETSGFNELTWLDNSGIPHSDGLRVTERMRRTGPDTMEIAFRFEDPKAFTRPWGASKTYLRTDFEILENIGYCEDRFQYNYKEKIFRGTVNWQSPEQAAGK